MKKVLLAVLASLLFMVGVQAQKHTITGFVSDVSNGEKLLSANVYNSKTYKGCVTNNYGFYSLTQPEGKISIKYSFVGYQPVTLTLNLLSDTTINIELTPTIELEEIEVKASGIQQQLESSQMSVTELPIQTIKKLPVFFGEVDIMKTIQLLPGVQSGNEGTSGIYVRGGGSDENLILLDGVPVYNANHLFGFFSVFNADALNSVTLVKGGFPARYGGRLSSVLDIRMKEGNTKKFQVQGTIGLIASKLTLEGPVVKDKSSFIISARRTYIDVLSYPIQLMANKMQGNSGRFYGGYYFYDLNGKINWKFSDKSRLYLSAYMGNDKAYANNKYESTDYKNSSKFKLRWGNITTALRWNYIFNKKLFVNFRTSYSRYNFLVGEKDDNSTPDLHEKLEFEYFSGIDDLAASADFDFIPATNHYIRFGVSNIYHTFNPGVNAFSYNNQEGGDNTLVDTTFGNNKINANEIDAYVEDDFSIGNYIKFNLGIHASGFYVKNTFYKSFQPRAALRVIASEKLSLKASYATMAQYVHLLTNTSIGLPTDLWVPVTDTIKPMRSQQVAIGSVYNLNDMFEISLEGYYKWLYDVISYKPGSSYLTANNDWQEMITVGNGWSYGVELLIRKDLGKLTGWIGYTLSWSWRKFEEVSPDKFPYHYDRRHDISIVATYKLSDKVDFGATWVFGTGAAITLPYDKYIALGDYTGFIGSGGSHGMDPYINYVDNVQERNNYRTPNYHRLDLGVNFHKKKKWGERTWSVGLYNAYFRQNYFFIFVDYDYDHYNGTGQPEKVLKQVSLFPGMPYISYSFKF
ncbi:MAG: TonB-dependent receptor [Bacteroidetes bacterium]|nr:MAG: TonB-dependent receptor [Bacteroidota bacterium]